MTWLPSDFANLARDLFFGAIATLEACIALLAINGLILRLRSLLR